MLTCCFGMLFHQKARFLGVLKGKFTQRIVTLYVWIIYWAILEFMIARKGEQMSYWCKLYHHFYVFSITCFFQLYWYMLWPNWTNPSKIQSQINIADHNFFLHIEMRSAVLAIIQLYNISMQRSRLTVVRWSETTRNYVGPPEHSYPVVLWTTIISSSSHKRNMPQRYKQSSQLAGDR